MDPWNVCIHVCMYSYCYTPTCFIQQGAIKEHWYISWAGSTKYMSRCSYQIDERCMVCYVAVVKLATVFRCKCQIKEQDVGCCVAVVNCHATYNRLLFNPLNAELNLVCHLLALLGAHPILHVSRIRVNLTFASEHVLCWPSLQNVSVLLENGPLLFETCRIVTVWISGVNTHIGAWVRLLYKITARFAEGL
jgi:hypothetical protein